MINLAKSALFKLLVIVIIFVSMSNILFAQPTISSFSPISGAIGSSVTITGTGFNTTANQNIVFFGATMAAVTSTTSISLTVTIPNGTTYQNISVTNLATNLTAYSSKPFITTYNNGGSVFNPKVDFTAGSFLFGTAIYDLDGDGKPDVVTSNYSSNTVSVFRNTSTSGVISYAAIVDLATGAGPKNVSICDVDGDGIPDIAVVNSSSSTISVFRNTSTFGSISFSAKVDFATGSNPSDVAIGDLDGDGKPDLVSANYDINTVSVFRNTATSGSITTGSFATKVDFATGTNPWAVVIGDLDGDGKPDLAAVNSVSKTISVLRNTSTSGSIIFLAKVDFTTGSTSRDVAIGDLDGDGKPDLVSANYDINTVSVFRNTATSGSITTGSFATKVDFAAGAGPNSVAIGDIDGDGKPDLALSNYTGSTASVLHNISTSGSITTGSFTGKVDFSTNLQPICLAIGDLDGDGKPDLVTANVGNTFSVLRNAFFITTITSFSPLAGIIGSSVTITGTGFNTITNQNIVYFGATKATVTAATSTSLTVTVPTGTTYQNISVTNLVTNLTGYSLKPFITTYNSIGSTAFAPKVDFATDGTPLGIVIGDIDGDGKSDVVTANFTGTTVSVLRNTSTSGVISYAAKVGLATGDGPISVAVGDLDGDGKLDLVTANYSTTTVSVLRNTSISGIMSFAAKADFTVGAGPYSVAIGDIDGDGKPDLAIISATNNIVSVLRNTSTSGSISFASKVDFATGVMPYNVAIGDIDGDGKPDLVITNGTDNTVSVFRNTSTSGNISLSGKVDFATGMTPNVVIIGDLDGDGKPDLSISNVDNNTFSVLRNTSTSGSITSGSFSAKVDFTTGFGPIGIGIGDIDGNGKPDLVIANKTSNTVSIFRNKSTSGSITSSSFDVKYDVATGSSPTCVSIGDIDGDGKLDIAIGNRLGSSISALKNINVITTITSFSPLSGAIGSSVTITGTDFNTTANQNIVFFGATIAAVTAATSTSLTVTVPYGATYQNISVTNLATNLTAYSSTPFIETYNNGSSNFTPKVDYSAGTTSVFNPRNVAIGDIDGDGKPDVILANGQSVVSVYRNTSTSGIISFADKIDFTTGYTPFSVSIVDIDGDGKLDIATSNDGNNNISVLRNTSTSGVISFSTKIDFAVGYMPDGIAFGDLDGDGKPDLVSADEDDMTISVIRNTSTSGVISFANRLTFTTGSQPMSLVIGDLDGDGKLDLSITNYGSANITVLRNTSTLGSISFATKVNFSVGSHPRSIAIGDLDGDGKPDLAIANNLSNTISVLRNTATSGTITSGSFATKVDFTTPNGPFSVVIGDLDGDGKPDLAVANYAINSVSVFHNESTSGTITSSSFVAAKNTFPTGTSPMSVAIGDLNGDGKLDLAVANFTSKTISLYRNILLVNLWTGAVGTDWHMAGNWSNNLVPLSNDAKIQNVTNKPIISNGNAATVNDLTIDSGASLTNNGMLQIFGTITNNGTFTSLTGTIYFS